MIKRDFYTLIIFFLLDSGSFPYQTSAYEVATHEEISVKAAEQSNLNSYLSGIGLGSLDNQIESDYLGFPPSSPRFWIRYGANHEDDTISDGLSFTRYLNHFFNPLTGDGLFYQPPLLSHCVTVYGFPAPDWGLKEGQAANANQIFSFKDARDYFYKGLTEQNKNLRGQYLAMTFRTLGQVMHLIQDMAQPQHTRNDPHGPGCYGGGSLYEFYTNLDEVRLGLPYDIAGSEAAYGGADTTTFNTPRNFWTTSEGKGLADYSNRGFVSAGTNFDKPGLFPTPLLDSAWDEDKSAFCAQINLPRPRGPDGTELPCLMSFIRTFVEDRYRSTLSGMNHRASTYSIFSADLKKYNAAPYKLYTLNSFNFKDAHQFLIPRAVGYSAGLLNYFFRGKIDMEPDLNLQNPKGYLIKNLGSEVMNGTFTLYYDDENDIRYRVEGAEWTTSQYGQLGALRAGETMPVPAFAPPTDPAPKKFGEYILVFTGAMGEENPAISSVGDVAAKHVSFASPFLLLTTNVGIYRSQYLDQGWERLGDEWWGPNWTGQYIKEDLMILDGELFQYADGTWNWKNLRTPEIPYLGWLAYLGGTKLMAEGCTSSTCGIVYSPDLGTTWEMRAKDLDFRTNGLLWPIGDETALLNGIPYTTGEGWSLYRSTNGGFTWANFDSVGRNAYDQRTVDLMVWNQVEGAGSVLLAGGILFTGGSLESSKATCGLWKSVDEGNSWQLAWALADDCHSFVKSIAIDPQGNALMVVHEGLSYFLYKSTDAGETWIPIGIPDGSEAWGVMYLRNHLGVGPGG